MERWLNHEWTTRMQLKINYGGMMSEIIGEKCGISIMDITEALSAARSIADSVELDRSAGKMGFYNLPYDVALAKRLKDIAGSLRANCDDLVLVGIGGSALGSQALFHALCLPLHNLVPGEKRNGLPRFHVLDNIDPSSFESVIDNIDPKRTIFNVVTKAGTTTETISQFLIIRQMLIEKMGVSEAARHFVITTDNIPNPLRSLAEKEGYLILDIPGDVGGRFSVLSSVGLFPAAMLGIDIEELLAGAREMDKRCKSKDILQNPAYLVGLLHYLADTRKGMNIAVIMPYCDALFQMGMWFCQLWAESLGKEKDKAGNVVYCGQTPVAVRGATDQHSQLQLYTEGPFDKMVIFIFVENHTGSARICSAPEPDFAHLVNHNLGEIMNIEARSTELALMKAGRGSLKIIVPEVNPFTVGELLFLFEVQTVFTAGLYNINPFDQPGVVSSKEFIYGMLGRKGYERRSDEIRDLQSRAKKFVV